VKEFWEERIMAKMAWKVALLFGASALAGCLDTSTGPEPVFPDDAVDLSDVTPPPANPTKNAYFGDLHVHTRNSFDAFIFDTRASPDYAYQFAKGAILDNGAGQKIQLSGPPLDFLAVTDHGEYLGIVPEMAKRGTDLNKTKTAQSIFGLTAQDRRANFLRIGQTVVNGEEIEEIYDRDHMDDVWEDTVEAAEDHYIPGVFTTFAGYEFTAMTQVSDVGAANLHRNVIFRDEAPERLFTTLDSTNPEDLWSWMDEQRGEGFEAIAIPHNSNASNGQMFALESYTGQALNAAYGVDRLRNEPLVEITQVKGTSETHPSLAPNDEFSDFELYEYLIGTPATSDVVPGSFVRNALGRGLGIEAETGSNPYQFGFIGSSDTHLAAPSVDEETFFGKFPHDLDPEHRLSTPPKGEKEWPEDTELVPDLITTTSYGASGLAGVWAPRNTREDLFDAMRAKETFGTSGPRMKVRMFAGLNYSPDMLTAADMLDQAYAGGVPMGGELDAGETAPHLIAWAVKDPNGAPLQRLQIIKTWSEAGEQKDAIYDVACANGGAIDPATNRCAENGATVDLATCGTNDETGAGDLMAMWQDPNYDASIPAAYYVRVLENPKCRWSSWDAARNGTPPSPKMDAIIQDRAWGSPIWVR
jgi:hypothetical protein